MKAKPKVIVVLTEGGIVEIHSTDPKAVDIIMLDYAMSEEPEVCVQTGAYKVRPEGFNDLLDEAIEKLTYAIGRNEGDDDYKKEIVEWKADIDVVERLKV